MRKGEKSTCNPRAAPFGSQPMKTNTSPAPVLRFPVSRESAKSAENFACGCLIHSTNPAKLRGAVAATLRAWRAVGDAERVKWFHRHAYFIGNPYLVKGAR